MNKILLVLLLISPPAYSVELNPKNYVHIHYCYFDNQRYAFSISQEEFKVMKSWNLHAEVHPTVLPQDAEKIARAHVDKIKIPENHGWRLESISLEPINIYEMDKFMYTIQYSYYINGPMTGVWPYMKYIVTMDGKLIEPIIDEYKM